MGLGVNCGFAKRFGNVLMGTGFIAAKIQQRVRITWDCLPRILIHFLYLCKILYNCACRNVAGAHSCQFSGEAWQGHGGKLVQHEVDMAGQRTMVDLIGTVIQSLKRLRIEQAYQKIKCVVIIWDDSVQCALLFSEGVEVHIVMAGDGLNLRQVEGGQPDGSGHQNAFSCFA